MTLSRSLLAFVLASAGYYPTPSARAELHQLQVVLKNPSRSRVARGARVVRSQAGTPFEKVLDAWAASNVSASVQLPYFYSAPDIARVFLAMEIGPAGIKIHKQAGVIHSEMNVLAVAYNSSGGVAARFSDVVKWDFQSQKEADAFFSRPIHYEGQFELAPGNYRIDVAFSVDSDSLGKAEAPLLIEPYPFKSLALSSLALGKEVRPVVASNLDASSPPGPKAAGGVQLTPYGGNRFKQSERCMVYLEIYDPLFASANPPAVGLRFRIIDHKTGLEKADSGTFSISDRIRPGDPVVCLILSVPLAQLSPGAYEIEIRAANLEGGPASVRSADIEVE